MLLHRKQTESSLIVGVIAILNVSRVDICIAKKTRVGTRLALSRI